MGGRFSRAFQIIDGFFRFEKKERSEEKWAVKLLTRRKQKSQSNQRSRNKFHLVFKIFKVFQTTLLDYSNGVVCFSDRILRKSSRVMFKPRSINTPSNSPFIPNEL